LARVTAAEESGERTIPFADYLEARIALDERSLNADVREACFGRLAAKRGVVHCLDVGTGTGAMVRRILKRQLGVPLAITALDHDPTLLDIAVGAIGGQLRQLDYRTAVYPRRIEAEGNGSTVRVDFECRSLCEFRTDAHRYDLITAASFMDIVPIAPALSRFSEWLAPDGMFYAPLNYDGDTALFPLFGDAAFEAAVLAQYDDSMERRRAGDEAIGGSRSGRRLHSALIQKNFRVVAYGSSDWNITPRDGRYRGHDGVVLHALLSTIRREGQTAAALDDRRLAEWCDQRRAQIERSALGMIVHQIDILATGPQALTALT
jgi:SAM-dependent methyltransferase